MILLSEFLDVKIFDQLEDQLHLLQSFAQQHNIEKPFWIGETSFAYGGGAHGLSNTFVDGFNWLDKVTICSGVILTLYNYS